jgi:hypothetical protein
VIKLCSMTTGTPDTASVMVYLDDGPALNNGFMCPGGECYVVFVTFISRTGPDEATNDDSSLIDS